MASGLNSISDNLNINNLPDDIILHILHFLDVKNICNSGRVCRRWRRIVKDNKLWRHVDLRPYKLNMQKIWKVLRAHFSDILLSLHIRGYLDPTSINWMKHNLSNAMLKELKERCPNMKTLTLIKSNLSSVSAEHLPCKLQELCITSCFLPPKWFSHVDIAVKQSLLSLDLSNSSKLSNMDLKDIKDFNNLQFLSINGCYRVTEEGLLTVNEFTKLSVLEMAETGCTDLNLHHIARRNTLLTKLNLRACRQITDGGLSNLATGLKKLNYLDVTKCEKLSPAGIRTLDYVKQLKSDEQK